MQERTDSEKDIRRTPTSPLPRFSRTFDRLLSRVRLAENFLPDGWIFSSQTLVSGIYANINAITRKFSLLFSVKQLLIVEFFFFFSSLLLTQFIDER